ncbi:hypothetical protein ANCCAN_08095 [Ancylostoma caninum]|uniref:Tetratricopeptide repeat protein n=1 Tax=Ancylostoma caninum TaxID=29170 RepID=A0A368GSB4_ANCCA|nr:hypothetical protein ANCCAN_08095 [Ancylostoma caninum]
MSPDHSRYHAIKTGAGAPTTLSLLTAIDIYSRALSLSPSDYDRSILLSNRGMGYLCRRWEGDSYACVRDCVEALLLYPGNSKALWRLTRSLMLLEQWDLAKECIDLFKRRFPNDRSIVRLTDQVSVAMDSAHAHQSHVMCDDKSVLDYSGENFCERRIAEPWSHFGQRNRHPTDERDIFLRLIGSQMVCGHFLRHS